MHTHLVAIRGFHSVLSRELCEANNHGRAFSHLDASLCEAKRLNETQARSCKSVRETAQNTAAALDLETYPSFDDPRMLITKM
jgi:hypothetical protein